MQRDIMMHAKRPYVEISTGVSIRVSSSLLMHAKRHNSACKETYIYVFHLLSMIKYEISEFSIDYARSFALTLFILIQNICTLALLALPAQQIR